jgi:hypothetical protein
MSHASKYVCEGESTHRPAALRLIYKHTHRDFKGRIGKARTILAQDKDGATCLVELDGLTDEQVMLKLPFAIRAERASKRS